VQLTTTGMTSSSPRGDGVSTLISMLQRQGGAAGLGSTCVKHLLSSGCSQPGSRSVTGLSLRTVGLACFSALGESIGSRRLCRSRPKVYPRCLGAVPVMLCDVDRVLEKPSEVQWSLDSLIIGCIGGSYSRRTREMQVQSRGD